MRWPLIVRGYFFSSLLRFRRERRTIPLFVLMPAFLLEGIHMEEGKMAACFVPLLS